MQIRFKLRNESGLHCRFCGNIYDDENRIPRKINLYETSPKKGIVCSHCRTHLESYLSKTQSSLITQEYNNLDDMEKRRKKPKDIHDELLSHSDKLPIIITVGEFKEIIQLAKKEVFDDIEKAVRYFRLKRTGQQEVSMMVREIKQRHLSKTKKTQT